MQKNGGMMRYLFILLVLVPSASVAQSVDCSKLKDADQRHYCRAVSMNNIAECASIMDRNTEIECRAQLNQKVTECGSILDQEQREQCRFKAEFGN